jgi:hypothetical protein
MPANKATPKGEITLVSKGDDGWKFAHSPSGLADFSVKQKLGKKFTFGVGFTVSLVCHAGVAGSCRIRLAATAAVTLAPSAAAAAAAAVPPAAMIVQAQPAAPATALR